MSVDPLFEDFCHSFDTGQRKVLIQTVIGRSGSLMIQSLLDGHQEILMFPGVLNFYSGLWEVNITSDKDIASILKEHFLFLEDLMFPYNIHDHVGENSQESTVIDYSKIINEFKRLNIDLNNRKKFFLGLHYVFGLYFNNDMSKVKYLYCHEHTIDFKESWIKNIIDDFLGCQIFCSVRDPLTNVPSIMKWTMKKRNINNALWQRSNFHFNLLPTYCIYWYMHGLEIIHKFKNNFSIIRLEDVQNNPEYFMRTLANYLKISYSDNLTQTTIAGKIWYGDIFSEKKMVVGNTAIQKSKKSTYARLLCYLSEINLHTVRKSLGYQVHRKPLPVIDYFILLSMYPMWYIGAVIERMRCVYYLDRKKHQRISVFVIVKTDLRDFLISINEYLKYIKRHNFSFDTKFIFIGK